ncbi:hypothetical protein D3C73_1427580 [compost metagenome]
MLGSIVVIFYRKYFSLWGINEMCNFSRTQTFGKLKIPNLIRGFFTHNDIVCAILNEHSLKKVRLLVALFEHM